MAAAAVLGLSVGKILFGFGYVYLFHFYEAAMARALEDAQARGVTHVIFGDLFLADLRAWREAS